MSIARHSHGDDAGSGAFTGHDRRDRAGTRKQGMLRAAVTVTATGLALAVPLSSQAWADLNPAVLKSLQLDSATVKQVKAYDKYRTREADQREDAKKALKFARKQIGKPYRWGAEGPGGYDCSGLAMAAWRKAGVDIPRVTHAQYRGVKRKVKLKNLKPGDLIFFRGRNHVGMYVGDGKYLHAPRTGEKIRIDKLTKRRKKQFAGAVRPGAPKHRKWSPSVRELVEKIDRMSVQKRADQKPPDKERTPQIPPPDDTVPKTDNSPMHAPGHTPAEQAAPPGGPASKPDDSAAQDPRSDAPSDDRKPEPRPMYGADQSAASDQGPFRNGSEFRPWGKYLGDDSVFSAPGHAAG
ncbi:C40 family peptidase [Actinomadura sp. 7K507]|uniref:C40 family peptidase n=1 Tax=Actinomadura sp. 7K507 TaxID=2530365 RepID=UPI0014049C67|nr:C40 family peptidase [Actinomadura sp. 7K507]